MSTDLSTHVRDAYVALDDAQTPLTVEEIMHRAGPVRPLPMDEPRTVERNWRMPLLVAAIAAAVVLIALVPVLFLNTQPDQTPATTPPTVTSTTLDSTPTTAVEENTEAGGSTSKGSSDWTRADTDWQILAVAGKVNDQFIAIRTGIDQHVYNFEVDPPEYVGIDDPDGDDRSWLFRSVDGTAWTRQPLPEFDGTVIRSTVEAGLLWVEYINGDLDGEGLFVSSDGDSWATVQFDYGNGEFVADSPAIFPYFASLRGPRFVRSRGIIIAPGRPPQGPDHALWVSTDDGKTFQATRPFDTPHARTQVGLVGDGFFAIGVDAERMIVASTNVTLPSEITYSTAYSTDGLTWTPGQPFTVPFSGGGGGTELADDRLLLNGPIQDGSAAINYFLYPEQDQTIVAAHAVLDGDTVGIEEITRGNRCPHTVENQPCLPYSSFVTPVMFRNDDILISKIEDVSTIIRISRDGITWEPISLDGAPFNRIAWGLVTVADGTIFHAPLTVTGEVRSLWTHTP